MEILKQVLRFSQGLTTYEYVIAMRAQSVPQAINDCASEKETLDQKVNLGAIKSYKCGFRL
jgi:transposase-like protein